MYLKKLVFLALIALNGCAISTYQLPVVENPQVVPIRDQGRERLREGNVLFVNRSDFYRDVLVFDGRYCKDDILAFGPDGYPVLTVKPMGVFSLDMADNPRDPYPQYKTRLMGGFYSGQEITLLVFSRNIFDQTVGPPQITTERVATEPGRDVYTYRPYINVRPGTIIREVVNDAVYLPDMYADYYGGNSFDVTIDANMLLRRGIHRIRNRNP